VKKNYFSELSRCYLIAEIGVNHNGDIDLAKNMIKKAKEIGADAVKFQTFTADKLVSQNAPKVPYQKESSNSLESHYEMIRKLELSHGDHFLLKEYADNIGIDFLSTPYDVDSAKFLHEELDVPFFKTASADIIDLPLHKFIASTGKPSIISVGMASLGEIETVLDIYNENCSSDIVLLHCVSNYPCSYDSLNISVMNTLKGAFNLPVGFSDHSIGFEAAMLSIALGAKVIEKHFTTDKKLPGPDHLASSDFEEFSDLVIKVRHAERIMGSQIKRLQDEEKSMFSFSRKSIHIVNEMMVNDELNIDNIILKRPGTGLPPDMISSVIGRKISKNLKKGEMLDISHFQ